MRSARIIAAEIDRSDERIPAGHQLNLMSRRSELSSAPVSLPRMYNLFPVLTDPAGVPVYVPFPMEAPATVSWMSAPFLWSIVIVSSCSRANSRGALETMTFSILR